MTKRDSVGKGRILRLTFSVLLLPTGAVLLLTAGEGRFETLVSKLGLALIVAGVVSVFRETFILRLETEETADDVASRVHEKILQYLPRAAGIRMISEKRRGFDEYYTWATVTRPENLFFAGRSVLHRVDEDFQRQRNLGPAEHILARKIKEGSQIRVLFVDPRSDMIERLAREEGQTERAMLQDIARSIGICRRLYDLLSKSPVELVAGLWVRLYDAVPYFSYHREDDKVIVGFYFTTSKGYESSAFEVTDAASRKLFEDHFLSIFDKADRHTLLEVGPHRNIPQFNDTLYGDLHKHLAEKLGQDTLDKCLAP